MRFFDVGAGDPLLSLGASGVRMAVEGWTRSRSPSAGVHVYVRRRASIWLRERPGEKLGAGQAVIRRLPLARETGP